MKCVEKCGGTITNTTVDRHIMIDGKLTKVRPCNRCGRMHKANGTGADNSAGRRYFLPPGEKSIVLHPPKQ